MDPSVFLILMVASAVNMALPGPGIVLTFTRATCSGLPGATLVSAGILLSSLVLATAATAILAGLMEVSQVALHAARWIGLAVILGIALRLVFTPAAPDGGSTPSVGRGDLISGFGLGLSSPFNLLFLLALLPQFAPEQMGPGSAAAMIAAYLAGQFLVLAAVSWLGAAAGRAFLRGHGARLLERTAGVALAAFAVAAATSPI